MTGEGIGAAEQAGGQAGAAGGEQGPDLGRGDGEAATANGGDDLDGDAEPEAEFAEGVDIARLAAAEAEVIADDNGLGAEVAAEDALEELGGFEIGEELVERQDEGLCDARGSEQGGAGFDG